MLRGRTRREPGSCCCGAMGDGAPCAEREELQVEGRRASKWGRLGACAAGNQAPVSRSMWHDKRRDRAWGHANFTVRTMMYGRGAAEGRLSGVIAHMQTARSDAQGGPSACGNPLRPRDSTHHVWASHRGFLASVRNFRQRNRAGWSPGPCTLANRHRQRQIDGRVVYGRELRVSEGEGGLPLGRRGRVRSPDGWRWAD